MKTNLTNSSLTALGKVQQRATRASFGKAGCGALVQEVIAGLLLLTSFILVAPPAQAEIFTAISADGNFTCVLTSSGGVNCWGYNGDGALGDGTTTTRYTAVPVTILNSPATAIDVGGYHACVITNGIVQCWGRNNYGQLGNGTTTNSTVAVTVSGLSGVTAISKGAHTEHTCVLTSNGVYCWGPNNYGQLGDGTTTDRYTPVLVNGVSSSEVKAIATGGDAGIGFNTCVLTNSGSVKCWGHNNYGQLGDGTTTDSLTPVDVKNSDGSILTGIVAIDTAGDYTCALTGSGAVKCWGNNNAGQLGDGSTTNRSAPVNVSGLNGGVIAIAVADQSCALLSGGSVKCWGLNDWGQVGDGTTTNRLTPVDINIAGVTAIATGGGKTCAITDNGSKANCWGINNTNDLGDGTNNNRPYPGDVIFASSCVTPPSDMIAWYPLDEASGNKAYDIVGQQHGNYINPLIPVPGMVNNGSSISSGVNQLVIENGLFVRLSNLSVEFWFKAEKSSPYSIDFYYGGWVDYYGGDNLNSIGFFDGDIVVCGWRVCFITPENSPIYDAQKWNHFAVTLGQTGSVVYLNGQEYQTLQSAVFELGDTDYGITIPSQVSGVGGISGSGISVDEISFFRRVLSPSEISAIYQAGVGGKCKPTSYHPTSIGGLVWQDLNGNGFWDNTDTVLPNAKLSYTVGSLQGTVTTDADGKYALPLPNTLPANYTISKGNEFSNWKITYPINASYTGVIQGVVQTGDQLMNLNFGLQAPQAPGAIKGTVYEDLNGNCIKDANENGLSMWLVFTEYGTDELVELTDNNGNYNFADMDLPGSYTTYLGVENGWVQTCPQSPAYYDLKPPYSNNGVTEINFGVVRVKKNLTVTKTGNGTITSTPAGITCGADCTEDYASGTVVTLTATPDVGYAFLEWTGDCSGTNATTTVTMDAAKNCTATFELGTMGLTLATVGSGTVTCNGSTCQSSYPAGDTVNLVATPASGFTFKDWTGDCVGTSATTTVTLDAAKNCTATFVVVNPPETPETMELTLTQKWPLTPVSIILTNSQMGTTPLDIIITGCNESVHWKAEAKTGGYITNLLVTPAEGNGDATVTISYRKPSVMSPRQGNAKITVTAYCGNTTVVKKVNIR